MSVIVLSSTPLHPSRPAVPCPPPPATPDFIRVSTSDEVIKFSFLIHYLWHLYKHQHDVIFGAVRPSDSFKSFCVYLPLCLLGSPKCTSILHVVCFSMNFHDIVVRHFFSVMHKWGFRNNLREPWPSRIHNYISNG